MAIVMEGMATAMILSMGMNTAILMITAMGTQRARITVMVSMWSRSLGAMLVLQPLCSSDNRPLGGLLPSGIVLFINLNIYVL